MFMLRLCLNFETRYV